MPQSPSDKDLDETKRIMERLVKTPPDHRPAKPKGESDKNPKKEKPAK